MNPSGMFYHGRRMKEFSVKDTLPLSGRLIPEFDRRQSIRDMFRRKPTLSMEENMETSNQSVAESALESSGHMVSGLDSKILALKPDVLDCDSAEGLSSSPRYSATRKDIASPLHNNKRRLSEMDGVRSRKRAKSLSTALAPSIPKNGQQSLNVFFKPRSTEDRSLEDPPVIEASLPGQPLLRAIPSDANFQQAPIVTSTVPILSKVTFATTKLQQDTNSHSVSVSPVRQSNKTSPLGIHDPIESKESWSKLFNKPAAPCCEGHNELCICLVTKKSGINCGRSFWMCSRPLGPSGAKEKGTQWRCQTFIWCSDWNSMK